MKFSKHTFIKLGSALFSLVLLTLFSCEEHEFSTSINASQIIEPTINNETVGEIHNRYLHDGMIFFCENYTGNNIEETTLATYNHVVEKFMQEYNISEEAIQQVLEESSLTPIDVLSFDIENIRTSIEESEYGPFFAEFEEGFVNVQSYDDLEALFLSLQANYQGHINEETLGSFISVTRKSYQYWDAYYDSWIDCRGGENVNDRGPNDGGKRVISADAAGAIQGAIVGGYTGAVLGVGVGAVPGAIGGAMLSATYSSLFASITYLFW